jgi:hypothetical protein
MLLIYPTLASGTDRTARPNADIFHQGVGWKPAAPWALETPDVMMVPRVEQMLGRSLRTNP